MNRSLFRWTLTFGLSILLFTSIAIIGIALGSSGPLHISDIVIVACAGVILPVFFKILEVIEWWSLVSIVGIMSGMVGLIVIVIDTVSGRQTIQEAASSWALCIIIATNAVIYDVCRYFAEKRYPREADVSGHL